MCGLYGAISTTLSQSELDVVYNLAIISTLRGIDSTGLSLSYKEKHDAPIKHSWIKNSINAIEFYADKEVRQLIKDTKPLMVMGHNRSATVGGVTTNNAHPFETDTRIGMHNGTLYHPFKIHGGSRTDSEEMFMFMEEKGLKETLLEMQHGAYALSSINKTDDTIEFVRNDKRTLFFMWGFSGQTLYWASERRFLVMAADRSPLVLKEEDIFILKVGELLTVPIGKHPKQFHTITDYTEHLKPKTEGYIKYAGGEFVNGVWSPLTGVSRRKQRTLDKKKAKELRAKNKEDGGSNDPLLLTKSGGSDSKNNAFLDLVLEDGALGDGGYDDDILYIDQQTGAQYSLSYVGYNKHVMDIKEANRKLAVGCCICATNSTPEEEVHWIHDDTYICDDCSNDGIVEQYWELYDRTDTSELVKHYIIGDKK